MNVIAYCIANETLKWWSWIHDSVSAYDRKSEIQSNDDD